MRKPGDFVITPDPIEIAFRIWLTRMLADTIIIEFDQIGQMVAFPTAESDTAFAFVINAVGKT